MLTSVAMKEKVISPSFISFPFSVLTTERERKRERQTETETERERISLSVTVVLKRFSVIIKSLHTILFSRRKVELRTRLIIGWSGVDVSVSMLNHGFIHCLNLIKTFWTVIRVL